MISPFAKISDSSGLIFWDVVWVSSFPQAKTCNKFWDFLGCNKHNTEIVFSETGNLGRGCPMSFNVEVVANIEANRFALPDLEDEANNFALSDGDFYNLEYRRFASIHNVFGDFPELYLFFCFFNLGLDQLCIATLWISRTFLKRLQEVLNSIRVKLHSSPFWGEPELAVPVLLGLFGGRVQMFQFQKGYILR